MSEGLQSLFYENDSVKGFEKRPPNLRTVCSASCAMPARSFAEMLSEARVTAVLDTRVTRTFRGQGFSSQEDDFRYICELNNIDYIIEESLAPSKEMREVFAKTFKNVKRSADRDPMAWTKFLEAYEKLLMNRRPFRQKQLYNVIMGKHESIAVICSCRHHDDCHRSYATGLMANLLEDVKLKVLYPNGVVPPKKSPRRYRFKEFKWASLLANGRR